MSGQTSYSSGPAAITGLYPNTPFIHGGAGQSEDARFGVWYHKTDFTNAGMPQTGIVKIDKVAWLFENFSASGGRYQNVVIKLKQTNVTPDNTNGKSHLITGTADSPLGTVIINTTTSTPNTWKDFDVIDFDWDVANNAWLYVEVCYDNPNGSPVGNNNVPGFLFQARGGSISTAAGSINGDNRVTRANGTSGAAGCSLLGSNLFDQLPDIRISTADTNPLGIGIITAFQETADVQPGDLKAGILRIDIPTSGSIGTLTLNSVRISAQNTSNADVTNVKLWNGYDLSSAVLIGSPQLLAGGFATFSGLSIPIASGTTSLWLTYDIAPSAILNNTVDIKIAQGDLVFSSTGGAISPGSQPLSALNPLGNRRVFWCSLGLYTLNNSFYAIDRVQVRGVDLHNPPSTGYTGGFNAVDYSSIVVRMNVDSVYSFDVAPSTGGEIHWWIDFNDNLEFEPSESVGSGNCFVCGSTGGFISGNFSLPANAVSGNHRMRLRLTDSPGSLFNTDACTVYNFGETHDYTAQIIASACQSAFAQANSISVSLPNTTSATISWVNGGGSGRAVYINTSNQFTPPVNGSSPSVNTTYSSGQQCVFFGNGSGPVTITGLTTGVTYFARIFEFCEPGKIFNVLSAENNPKSFTTTCVNPDLPVISFSSDTVCTGDSVLISVVSGNLSGASAWKWYSGSCGQLLVGSGNSVWVTPQTNSTYFSRGEGGCVTSPGICASAEVIVDQPQTWYQDQDGDRYPSKNSLATCNQPTGYFPVSYFIKTDADCNDNDPSIHPDAIEVIDNIDNNCNELVDEIVNNLIETQAGNSISVVAFPNPNSGNFINLELSGLVKPLTHLMLFDARGRQVQDEMLSGGGSVNVKVTLDSEKLMPGLYLLCVVNGNQYRKISLIISR